MNEVEERILKHKGIKREIMLFFHELFIEEYGLHPKLSYKIPMYYRNKWVVYLNPDNREGVELAFTNGFRLSNKHTLVESKGRKMVKSVEFSSLEEIPLKEVKAIIDEAIKIDTSFKSNS